MKRARSYSVIYIFICINLFFACSDKDSETEQEKEQESVITFEKTFGEGEFSFGYCVRELSDGYIIAGTNQDPVLPESHGYLLKLDMHGNKIWSYPKSYSRATRNQFTVYEPGFSEQITSVEQSHDGGFITTGYSVDDHSFQRNAFLKKFEKNGTLQWYNYQQSGGTQGNAVIQTDDHGFVLVGQISSELWLLKTDENGNEIWRKRMKGLGKASGQSLQLTDDSGFIITGTTWLNYPREIYLVKTDNLGNILWEWTFMGNGYAEGSAVELTIDGGYVLTGWTVDDENNYNVIMIKTDSNGYKQWSKVFGGSARDYGHSIQQTHDQGYIIAGETRSFGSGSCDVYLLRTDPEGNELWSKTYGGAYDDYGCCVRQTADKGYIVVGSTDSVLPGTYIYVIKTDLNGQL